MSELLIYSYSITPRLTYILDVILVDLLNLSYEITTDLTVFESASLPKINYSNINLNAAYLQVEPQGLLHKSSIEKQSIEVHATDNFPIFFKQATTFGFDIFAASFYLLTRYEEYLPFESDQYGRFPAKESLAYEANFLDQPIIHYWANYLKEQLEEQFNEISIKPICKFSFQPTFDIDLAWAFKNRSFYRTIGGIASDLLSFRTKQIKQRISVLLNLAPDPFFIFDHLKAVHNQYQFKPIFFFLLGDYSTYDKNIAPKHPALIELIKTLQEDYTLGIHPSYASNESFDQLQKEIHRLSNIIQTPILKSRQHYLKLSFPSTYQNLIATRITEDYSMGYAGAVGFRASIAQPFYWFDLSKNERTKLRIHSFQVMDVTLKQYLSLSPEKAVEQIKGLIDATYDVGGEFISLWHNSSFSELEGWQKWKKVYANMLDYAHQKQSNTDHSHSKKDKE